MENGKLILVTLIVLVIFLVTTIILIKKTKRLKGNINKLKENLNKQKERIDVLNIKNIEDSNLLLRNLESEIKQLNEEKIKYESLTKKSQQEYTKVYNELEKDKKKLEKSRILYKAMNGALKYFDDSTINCDSFIPISEKDINEIDTILPTVELHLQSLNYKDLRKKQNENTSLIKKVLATYQKRYTTKTNKALYNSMVLALSSELQNILIELKYGTVDKAKDKVHKMITKYLIIAAEGNQTIAGTLKKCVYQLEELYFNAIDIEYLYYVRREQAKEEQRKIREKIREERAEKKLLEEQQKKMQEERSKYQRELERLNESITNTKDEKELEKIKSSIEEINKQVDSIDEKEEEILTLMNGKAGNVYVISNIGSFGKDVFKIGMTRRLDPQTRVDELGSASVPFKFDVHSFIFSEDASTLETEIHKKLEDKRINKVNKRKEFFKVSIDDIETLVNDINPSAEFNKTILAEEYKQSLSLIKNLDELENYDDEKLKKSV